MNYELLSLTVLFLKIGIIGTIICILSILLIPKNKKIISGILIITIILLVLEIIGAIILLISFDNSPVSSIEDTKVAKSNIASNGKSKSSTIKSNTSSSDKDTTSKSTTKKDNIAEVEKNDNSTIKTNTNNKQNTNSSKYTREEAYAHVKSLYSQITNVRGTFTAPDYAQKNGDNIEPDRVINGEECYWMNVEFIVGGQPRLRQGYVSSVSLKTYTENGGEFTIYN